MFSSLAVRLFSKSNLFHSERLAFVGLVTLALAAPFECFEPLFSLGRFKVTNLVALMCLALGIWGIHLVISRRWPSGWQTEIAIPLSLLLIFAVLSSFVASLDFEAAIKGLVRLIFGVAVFLMVVDLTTTSKRVKTLVCVLIITGCVVASFGLMKWLGWSPIVTFLSQFQRQDPGDRLLVFNSVSTTALALAMTGCLTLGMVLTAYRHHSWQVTGVWSLAGLLIFIALGLTMSRGGLIAFAVGLFSIFILRKQSSIWRWWLIGGVVAVILMVATLRELRTYGSPAYSSGLSGRPYLWAAALQIGFERPWLGLGPNNFRLLNRAHVNLPEDFPRFGGQSDQITPIGVTAHNLYLEFLADLGWPGLFIWLLLTFMSLRLSWPLLTQSQAIWSAGIAGALIVWWFHSLLEAFIWVTSASLFFWLILGLVVATHRNSLFFDQTSS